MKVFLILFLILFNASSFACVNRIAKSEALKAINKVPNAGSKTCKELPLERCLCFDGVVWEYAKIRPEKWLKEQAESCSDESDCQDKLESLSCLSDGFYPIKNIDSLEVYCTKFRPEKIVDDSDKKAIFDAAQAVKAQEKADAKAERQEIKGFIQDVNSSDLPQWHKKILKRVIRDMRD